MATFASNALILQRKLEEIACYVSAMAVATMMSITVLEVFARALFRISVPGSYEYVSLMFVYLIYLGLGFSQRRDAHITVGILYDHMPRRAKKIVEGLYLLIACLFFGALTWTSGVSAFSAYVMGDTVLGIIEVKTWWARAGIPVGLALFSTRFLIQLIDLIKNDVLLEEAAAAEEETN
ncbi:TRAP transporter small permease [Pseudoruegeria sp. SHC-113]|uniref:TRAP transporter small permease n=1 Tax=Pseudoruegeria sp. SHC-113 TaxID=2855439 RepID=UPI0021BB6DB7|nr:TRAP transporter small permease [Pseudoruegeria sp. SHC-113]MCT8162114.1 TRAP transporter small permease [Pseudoruegeria sp. SHC-113]